MIPRALVVLRRGFLDGTWYVCHAASYQNAIRYPANGTQTREQAAALARANGFEVTHHADDPAQRIDA